MRLLSDNYNKEKENRVYKIHTKDKCTSFWLVCLYIDSKLVYFRFSYLS